MSVLKSTGHADGGPVLRYKMREVSQMETGQMMEQWKMIGTLERFAETSREHSLQDHDVQTRAYMAGKADGLALASGLLRTINKNGHSDRSQGARNVHDRYLSSWQKR